jgi:hypothetical protein
MSEDLPRVADAGMEDDEEFVQLHVNDPGVTTYWGSVPLTGQGPSNGTLLVEANDGNVQSVPLGGDGSFCVDVSLTKGSVNTITIEAISAMGKYSAPHTVQVRQEGEPPEQGGEGTPQISYKNIARNATNFLGTVSTIDGSFYYLGDGSTSAFVTIKNNGNLLSGADNLYFKLSDTARVKELRFLSTTDCVLQKFTVYLSDNNSDPGSVGGSAWTQVADVTNGSSDYKVTPSSTGDARWLGIDFNSRDCGPAIGAAHHKLIEIEAWAEVIVDDDGEGGTGAPSCASGF